MDKREKEVDGYLRRTTGKSIEDIEKEFGTHKKVTVIGGKTFLVPTRDILVEGIKAWELEGKYPEVAE